MFRRGASEKRFLATVVFTDIVGSTDIASELGDRRWRELLARHHAIVRRELKRFRGREIDTAGDGFFATFDAPIDGIRCASAAAEAVQQLGIDIRAGIHVGECEQMGKKVGGIAVHTGARILGAAGAAEVLVSNTAKDLVAGSKIDFADRGLHRLKGIDGEWRLFAVTSVDDSQRTPPLDPTEAAERRSGIAPAPITQRRSLHAAVAAIAVIAIAGAGFVALNRHGAIVPGPNTVSRIPAGSDAFAQSVDVGGAPTGVAAGDGSVWVVKEADSTVERVDLGASLPVVETKATGGAPTGVAAGEGAAWITTGFGTAGASGQGSVLYRFDPASDQVTKAADLPSGTQAIAVGDGSIWIADQVNDQVIRIDPKTDQQIATIDVGVQPVALALGTGAESPVWVANAADRTVSRIDPATNRVESFDLTSAPTGIAVGDGAVWVTSSVANTLTRLNETDGSTVATVRNVSRGPGAVVVAGDAVWVAGTLAGRIAQVDPRSNRVTGTVAVHGVPSALAIDPSGNLWVTVHAP